MPNTFQLLTFHRTFLGTEYYHTTTWAYRIRGQAL